MTTHSFNKSQKVEIQTQAFHDLVYKDYIDYLAEKEPGSEFKLVIDRNICNYKTALGNLYQTNDSDVLLNIKYKGAQGEKSGVRRVSEKVRTRWYKDIYFEAISMFHCDWHSSRVAAPGWGFKEDNKDYSPHMLSMLFVERGAPNFTSIFIPKYKELKKSLNDVYHMDKLIASPNFIGYVENLIRKNEFTSFQVQCPTHISPHVNKIVIAYNKNKGSNYYTIGLTFRLKLLNSLEASVIHEKTLPNPVSPIFSPIIKSF